MRLFLTRVLVGLFAAALTGCGQTDALETRTFQLRHLEPEIAREIVQPYVFTDRPDSPGTIAVSSEGRSLTVRERSDNLDRITRVLADRDQPLPGVVLHFQIIETVSEETAVEPAIADVEAALREVFRFRGYRLVGQAVVRASDRSDFSQVIAGPAAEMIQGRLWGVQELADGQLNARLTVDFWTDEHTPALKTTVNLVDGRTLVLGTAGERTGDGALILAVRPIFEK